MQVLWLSGAEWPGVLAALSQAPHHICGCAGQYGAGRAAVQVGFVANKCGDHSHRTALEDRSVEGYCSDKIMAILDKVCSLFCLGASDAT